MLTLIKGMLKPAPDKMAEQFFRQISPSSLQFNHDRFVAARDNPDVSSSWRKTYTKLAREVWREIERRAYGLP